MIRHALLLGLIHSSAPPATGEIHSSPGRIKPFGAEPSTRSGFRVFGTPLTVPVPDVSFSIGAFEGKPPCDGIKRALAYLASAHAVPPDTIEVTSAHTSKHTRVTHVYARQTVNGIPVSNAHANVNVDAHGRILSASSAFARGAASVPRTPRSRSEGGAAAAVQVLIDYVSGGGGALATRSANVSADGRGFTVSGIPPQYAVTGAAHVARTLHQTHSGELVDAWSVELEQRARWWHGDVDVASRRVLGLSDWYSGARSEAYNVYPRTVADPTQGPRQLVTNPALASASPLGWATNGTTCGNNVCAQANPSGGAAWLDNHRPHDPASVFDYPLDLSREPDAYVDAAVTQLFYACNTMHDLAFVYGFDEAAGNFQDSNFSGEGVGDDALIANAQDGSSFDNSDFGTPPDGRRPKMRMYLWDITTPKRDGVFELDIVAHEYTHGISKRLTGGPANADCLVYGEAGGLGEGWGDAVAFIVGSSSGDRSADYDLGKYVYTKGIRSYPYSTSKSTNPLMYGFLGRPDYQEAHAAGEIWAEILYEVYWNLVDDHGMSDDLIKHDLTKGNSLMLQLLFDGMKLQPCEPTFIEARDAIIQADQLLTGGANRCSLWKAFSKRGLGPNATGRTPGNYTEDAGLPSGCD